MHKLSTKVGAAFAIVQVAVFGFAMAAFASPDTPESLATSAGTSMRDTGIAVIAALIPLAVALLLAKRALPWARKFLHV